MKITKKEAGNFSFKKERTTLKQPTMALQQKWAASALQQGTTTLQQHCNNNNGQQHLNNNNNGQQHCNNNIGQQHCNNNNGQQHCNNNGQQNCNKGQHTAPAYKSFATKMGSISTATRDNNIARMEQKSRVISPIIICLIGSK